MNPYPRLTGLEKPAELLAMCGGFYKCPVGPDGKRLGPMVGYAARDGKGRQFVGDIYLNCSTLEQYPLVLKELASQLVNSNGFAMMLGRLDAVCAMPMGGMAFAFSVALLRSPLIYTFLEKEPTALKTATSRGESVLIAGRHAIVPGLKYALFEDLVNNGSTIAKAIKLIEDAGGHVVCIGCIFNRSPFFQNGFKMDGGREIPIYSVMSEALPEYEQDDPRVVADITAGNVVWSPKKEWPKLADAMKAFPMA